MFAASQGVAVKNMIHMLEDWHQLADAEQRFNLVIGGYGPLIDAMKKFAAWSALRNCTTFIGKLTKPQIAAQLVQTDGYLFSPNYETYSLACAEALRARVSLTGPNITVIANYAGPQDWLQVPERNPEVWCSAMVHFLETGASARWDRTAIAQRAVTQFSEATLREGYRQAMQSLGFEAEP